MEKIVLGVLAGWNLLVCLVYGWDKQRAIKGHSRVPERTLLTLSAFFGGAGAFLGMRLFSHKTRKDKFRRGIPALLIFQCSLLLVGTYYYFL